MQSAASFFCYRLIIVSLMLLCFISAQAGVPVWTINTAPGAKPTQTVTPGNTSTIEYIIQNHSSYPRTLLIQPIQGVTQEAPCQLAPKGQPGSRCTLKLRIDGNALDSNGIEGGPNLCEANADGSPDPNRCYQPDQAGKLHININALGLPAPTVSPTQLQLVPGCPKTYRLRITNYTFTDALNMTFDFGVLESYLQIMNHCPSNFSGACTIELKPIHLRGLPPPPTTDVLIRSDNFPTASFRISIVPALQIGDAYQQGIIFDVDACNSGKIVDNRNDLNNPLDLPWGGEGGILVDEIYYNAFPPSSACAGATDGLCNTQRIVSEFTGKQGMDMQTYAAGACAAYEIDSAGNTPCQAPHTCYNDWYLPAVCELGTSDYTQPAPGAHGDCPDDFPNIYANLREHQIGNFAMTGYHSSTEISREFNWFVLFTLPSSHDGGIGGVHGHNGKYTEAYTRCVRRF